MSSKDSINLIKSLGVNLSKEEEKKIVEEILFSKKRVRLTSIRY
ncbi:hypothetical protein [Lachnoanaerobaculum orale]|nr:hypothetical protein [Lachnoanaerobaculum orale]